MPNLTFHVNAKSENATKTVVEARTFKITIDEPKNLGGTDAGANPVEYLLAALSGCLSVVGHLVAKEMGITLRGITFSVSGDLDPAKFMGKSDQGRAGYQAITVAVSPDADADKATLEKWLGTVESRCPVSDNIKNPTPLTLALS